MGAGIRGCVNEAHEGPCGIRLVHDTVRSAGNDSCVQEGDPAVFYAKDTTGYPIIVIFFKRNQSIKDGTSPHYKRRGSVR